MEGMIATVVGIVTGFVLSSATSAFRSRTVWRRFQEAVRAELKLAKDAIHQKMIWISRDVSGCRLSVDPALLVDHDGRVLFLGEPEAFTVPLPFWEQNIRDIVELMPTAPFIALSEEISLVREFVAKFRDMKMAFQIGIGAPSRMALACFEELRAIHHKLCPGRPVDTEAAEPLVPTGSFT